jgi:hypothetical protein
MDGKEDPLREGELERAGGWGKRLQALTESPSQPSKA